MVREVRYKVRLKEMETNMKLAVNSITWYNIIRYASDGIVCLWYSPPFPLQP